MRTYFLVAEENLVLVAMLTLSFVDMSHFCRCLTESGNTCQV